MDDSVSLAKKLVSISSPTGQEKAAADFIEQWAKERGLASQRLGDSVVILPQPPASASSNSPPWTNRASVILYAHIDTVPAGDEKGWKHAPLAAESDETSLYGLGASDDKGAAACLMEAALKMKGKATASDVYYLFAAGEEKDGVGAQAFLKWWVESGRAAKYVKTWAVIGEPTDLKKVELGARGAFFIRFDLHGQSYHGADMKRKKDDALSKALEAAKLLAQLQKQVQKEHTHPLLGKPSISLTGIMSGERANKLPDVARLTLDVRTTPGFHEKAISMIENEMKKLDAAVLLEVSPRKTAPYVQEAGSPLAKQVMALTRAKAGMSRGSNDATFFLGAGIPAVVWGPGVKESIHKQDEYIPLAHLQKGAKLFAKLAASLDPRMGEEA